MHVAPQGIRFENHDVALGIDESAPRVSWRTTAPPGWRQTAYEIEVDGVGSGPVESPESQYRPWPAPPLDPRGRAVVRVRVRGDEGWSDWSAPGAVERGLGRDDWAAKAISPSWPERPDSERRPPLLRREFAVPAPISRARLYVTAHGVLEAEINGRRVGDDVLSPGWTSYHHRLVYRTHDVTELVAEGPNAIGAWLADGWHRGRIGLHGGARDVYGTDIALIAQLEIELVDGRRLVVATDESWTAATGPILRSGLYDGEHYDARELEEGWSAPGHDSARWSPVAVAPVDPSVLAAPDGPPIRSTLEVAPVAAHRVEPGRLILDFGQNLVGRIRFRAAGAPGSTIVLRHAEVLQDGELYTRPLRSALATDRYVFRGEGEETWEPRFTYHGFRFAELTAEPSTLDSLEASARVHHTDMTRIGWFECSDPRLDRLHDNVVWSTRGNFVGIPTDCPQRDERMGWTGDIQVFAPTAGFLFDTSGMLAGWLRDVASEQLPDGTVPWFVPIAPSYSTWDPIRPGAVWGDVAVLTPWDLWTGFGDRELLRRQWDSARAWVDLMIARAGDDRLWTGDFQLGDWLDPSAPPEAPADGRTDKDLVASAYFAWSTGRLAETALALGDEPSARHYAAVAEEIRAAFAERYLRDDRLIDESQTGYALVICFDLARTDAQRAEAGIRLRHLVEAAGHTIATGFAGTPLICRALSRSGSLDTAYRLLQQTDFPSWLYMVEQGATTIWERWDSQLPDGTVNPGQMTSFNHYALGAVAEWLHTVVAGLAPAEPGYRAIRFEPRPGGTLAWARAEHDTPYGRAGIQWRIEGDRLSVRTTVPTGATAELVLPSGARFALGPGEAVHEEPWRA